MTRLGEEPLRIAVVSSWPSEPERGGGTAAAILGLVRGLREVGHRVERVAPDGGGRRELLPRLRFNLALGLRRPGPFDLVVCVDFDGFALRGSAPRVVLLKGVAADEAAHERGVAALRLRTAAALEAMNAGRADRVVTPSRYAAEVAARRYGIDRGRFTVVPEPVLEPRGPAAVLEELPPRREEPTVLTVGRQYPRKRTADLVRALPPLARRIPAVRLRVVGDGPELPRLRRLAGELGVEERVTFTGRLTDRALAREYAGAWCFCLASEQEAYGIVAVEAMAAGLPVVAARAAALPEVVEDGVTGRLVRPRDPAALADALADLLARPDARRAMGSAGRRVVRERGPAGHAAALLEAAAPLPGERDRHRREGLLAV